MFYTFGNRKKGTNKDCKSFFPQYVLVLCCVHSEVISASFSCGMDTVYWMKSISIPRQVMEVDGGTNFLALISKPSSAKIFLRKVKQAFI